jgi:hypothetical protein
VTGRNFWLNSHPQGASSRFVDWLALALAGNAPRSGRKRLPAPEERPPPAWGPRLTRRRVLAAGLLAVIGATLPAFPHAATADGGVCDDDDYRKCLADAEETYKLMQASPVCRRDPAMDEEDAREGAIAQIACFASAEHLLSFLRNQCADMSRKRHGEGHCPPGSVFDLAECRCIPTCAGSNGCNADQCEYCDTSTHPEGICRPRCTTSQTCCGGVCRDPCPGGQPRDPISCTCSRKIYCSCNHTCWDTASACVDNCPTSLSCYTGNCAYATAGQC